MELNKIAEICKVKTEGWEPAVWDTLERKKDQVDRDGNIKSYGKPHPKMSNAVKILLKDSRLGRSNQVQRVQEHRRCRWFRDY